MLDIFIKEFFDKAGPGGHGYGRKDIAKLMDVSVMTVGRMIDDNRQIVISIRHNRVTGITENFPERLWYKEDI